MAFLFSLVALLRLRGAREQVEERKLLSLRHDAQRFELAIEQNVVARRAQRLQQASLLARTDRISVEHTRGGFMSADLQFSDFCLARLEFDAQQLRQQLAAKQEEIRRQLALFTEARRQREAIESLRDRQIEVYRAEERRREQRSLDDLFLLQLLRARRSQPHG